MNVFARKNILLSFSVLAAFLLSGCSMDPDVEITNKNVKDAVSSLSKADAAKVAALGGDKYLLGKTLNKVSKQLPADYYNYEINELVEHVLKRLKPIAAEKNIELVLESFRPVVAEIDEVKMTQVITNLVENAIKYNIANGWVRVSVNADHKFFYLTVADSGIGIPDDSRDKIFERFYRVDKARSRQTGGTGLGLAITKSVILMHKGAIRVYSKEGEGSTFTVRIPLTQAKKSNTL